MTSAMGPRIDGSGLAVVVVGGFEYSVQTNQIPGIMARELARRSPVLQLLSEAHGSVIRRLQGRARHLGARDVARTVLDSTHPRRVQERLWIAPVRGLAAIGPVWAPEVMRRRNVRLFAAVIRAWLQDVGARECVLVLYWWALPELVALVPNVGSVYDCVDDHAALPHGLVPPATVGRLEGQMLDAVDQTFVVSPHLLTGRQGPGRRVAVLGNAIDLRLFERLERDGFSTPVALRSIPHPVVGYAGGLGPRMDWELLLEVSARRPDWSFVFVGGEAEGAPEALRGRSNVFFLKTLPYTEALAAMASFDVATLPMCEHPFSLGNSFLKLRDYLAHGMPVVATSLPDPMAVAESAPGVVTLADGPDAWISAISTALGEPRSSPLRAARRRYAAQHSAERRAVRLVREALQARAAGLSHP